MKTEMNEMKELSLEEMERKNGGMIVDRGFWHNYYVISDYSGDVLKECFFKTDAENLCETYTSSKYVISEEQYNEWMEKKQRGERCPFVHND